MTAAISNYQITSEALKEVTKSGVLMTAYLNKLSSLISTETYIAILKSVNGYDVKTSIAALKYMPISIPQECIRIADCFIMQFDNIKNITNNLIANQISYTIIKNILSMFEAA